MMGLIVSLETANRLDAKNNGCSRGGSGGGAVLVRGWFPAGGHPLI